MPFSQYKFTSVSFALQILETHWVLGQRSSLANEQFDLIARTLNSVDGQAPWHLLVQGMIFPFEQITFLLLVMFSCWQSTSFGVQQYDVLPLRNSAPPQMHLEESCVRHLSPQMSPTKSIHQFQTFLFLPFRMTYSYM